MSKNVVDWYQDWHDDDIIADLDKTRMPVSVACENVNGDFHKANILRTLEAFNGYDFYLVGGKKMDMRAAVGTQNRIKPKKFDDFEGLKSEEAWRRLDYRRWIAVDNVEGAKSIYDYHIPKTALFIFGEEQRGLSEEALDKAHDTVYIPMYGAVRSLSVSTAAGIVLAEYNRRWR